MAHEDDVRTASRRFYEALNRMIRGEADTMAGAWAQEATSGAMHPIGGHDQGWEAVRTAFNMVGSLAGGGEVRLENQAILAGEDMACETGREVGSAILAGRNIAIDHRVTNVYRRGKDGVWRIVHHHTDEAPAMVALVEELQKEGAGAH
ncbi:MAG: nuclear transport factor 2 family protein [Rhodobacteraceae bacterium]|nr:nuclear transport factor 2 family protein [Paracoccaceae bacterium]